MATGRLFLYGMPQERLRLAVTLHTGFAGRRTMQGPQQEHYLAEGEDEVVNDDPSDSTVPGRKDIPIQIALQFLVRKRKTPCPGYRDQDEDKSLYNQTL